MMQQSQKQDRKTLQKARSYLSDPVGHSGPPDLLSHSRCPGYHSGTHSKGSDTFPVFIVAQLGISALLVPYPFSFLPAALLLYVFMAITILDSFYSHSFSILWTFTILYAPSMPSNCPGCHSGTVGARHAFAFSPFSFSPPPFLFFLLDAAWVRSRAERPSVSYTKVTAKSQGQAISCKYTTKTFKQISGSNKFLIAGDGIFFSPMPCAP